MYRKMFDISVITIFVFLIFPSFSICDSKEDTKLSQDDLKKYMKIMDTINVDELISNDRLMNTHFKCFLNEGPCVSQFKDLKKVLPELIKDNCSTCSDAQKTKMYNSIEKIRAKKPEEFDKFTKIYDPENKYFKKP
ncbi:ejaculatory bulb-specific protein 3-like [Daktulosphaira vitifoliae]|uniref:ejaculatory bulb-specific protein 3-like n=1 Tax=Daktulosphaira vitifoliae TaxID=58002 RepID=UPI0021AA2270|nr:ejaculatory bulb-specific protein 3-like [Daktulosphaira vitifoliae]